MQANRCSPCCSRASSLPVGLVTYQVLTTVRGPNFLATDHVAYAASAGAALDLARKHARFLETRGVRSRRGARVLVEVHGKSPQALHAFNLRGREVKPVPVPVAMQNPRKSLRAHATAAFGQGAR
jgi:hypothetical protein